MKKINMLIIAGTVIAGILLAYSFLPVPTVKFSSALSVFQVNQGGTGTSSPSGILYGDNSGSNPLKTVLIGSNLTFSGGTLSATGGSGSGNVATSAAETKGQIPFWTTTAGTPAKLGSVATGTLSATSPVTVTAGTAVIGGPATVAFDFSVPNTWTGLQIFSRASSTEFSVFKLLYVGGTATTSIDSAGNLLIPAGGSIAQNGVSDGCATWSSGVINSTGVACGSGSGAWPFTASTTFGTSTQSTTTPIWDLFGIYASSTSHFAFASSTALSASVGVYTPIVSNGTGNIQIIGQSFVQLYGFNAQSIYWDGSEFYPDTDSAYNLGTVSTGKWNHIYVNYSSSTAETISSKLYTPQVSGLAGDLSFFAPNGTDVFSASGPNSMIWDGTEVYASDNTSDLGSIANRWRHLYVVDASTSVLSVFSKAYFGGSATTTIDSAGNMVIPSGSNLTITGKSDGCATFATGVLNSTGSACGSGSGGAWPFSVVTNFGTTTESTSTVLNDSFGFYASSTSQFLNLNIWNQLTLKATSSALLGTDSSGNVVATTSIGTNFLTGTLLTVTTAAPLGGAATISQGQTLALTCATCATTSFWPFSAMTRMGTTTQGTTTPIYDQSGVIASSTSQFVNENIWGNLIIESTTSAILATDASGNVIASTTIGSNYISGVLGTINTSAPLGGGGSFSRGTTLTLTCATCITAAQWPFTAITTFGTTTQGTTTPMSDQSGYFASSTSNFVGLNIWGNLNLEATTSALLGTDSLGNVVATTSVGANYLTGVLGVNHGGTGQSTFTASQLIYGNLTAGLSSVGTSTLTASSPLTGSFIQIGSGGSLGCQTASGSQAGCISSTDWNTFNAKWGGAITTNFGTSTIASTTPAWFQMGFYASSTSQIQNLNIWNQLTLKATSSALLGTDASGNVVATTSIGVNLLAASGVTGSSCTNCNLSYTAAGIITSAANGSAGSGSWPFSAITTFGTTTQGTTTPMSDQSGYYASSTSNFVGLNIWGNLNLKATTSAILATDASGNVIASTTIGWNLLKGPASSIFGFDQTGAPTATSSIGANYITGPIFTVTTASPLGGAATINRGDTLALTCATCNTSSLAGSGVTGMMTAWSGANTLSATGTVMGGWMIATNTNATSTFNGNVVVASTSANTFRVNDGFGTNILNVNTSSTTAGYNLLDLRSATSTGTLFGVDQYGHVFASSTTPVLSSCGTSPSITTDSGDFSGTITVGSVAATGCTLTFGTVHVNSPHCLITNQSMSVVNAMTYTESTTGFTVSMTGLTGDKLDYICTGK